MFDQALQVLREQGATLIEITKFEGREQIGKNENTVLLTELKADMATYLATTPPAVAVADARRPHRLQQGPCGNRAALCSARRRSRMPKRPRASTIPITAKRAKPRYRLAGPEGIDRLLRENNVVALVGPTMPPAWPIDAVNGDQIAGGGAGSLAAVAGYPHLTVPMGLVKGLPVGLSFIGPKWSDGMILSLGYAYEQASHARAEPHFYSAIEDSPEIAPHLRPAVGAR